MARGQGPIDARRVEAKATCSHGRLLGPKLSMSLTLYRVHGCERCLRRHVQVVHKNQAALSKGWAIAALLPAMRGADAAICCKYQDRPLRYLNPILCPYSKMIAPRSAEGQRPVSLLSSLPSITSCVRQLWHARHA